MTKDNFYNELAPVTAKNSVHIDILGFPGTGPLALLA